MHEFVATAFTPLTALIGGTLIGLAAAASMALSGRIAGISGIASRLLPPYVDSDWRSRAAFIAGLIAAPALYQIGSGDKLRFALDGDLKTVAIAGLLVGFGAVWGNGCTSGHGVCGIARFSRRSIVATLVFMITAVVVVYVRRHVL